MRTNRLQPAPTAYVAQVDLILETQEGYRKILLACWEKLSDPTVVDFTLEPEHAQLQEVVAGLPELDKRGAEKLNLGIEMSQTVWEGLQKLRRGLIQPPSTPLAKESPSDFHNWGTADLMRSSPLHGLQAWLAGGVRVHIKRPENPQPGMEIWKLTPSGLPKPGKKRIKLDRDSTIYGKSPPVRWHVRDHEFDLVYGSKAEDARLTQIDASIYATDLERLNARIKLGG